MIEAADWIVWQLTGTETRNTCTAGYKAMWSKRDGFPSDAYFAALDPRFEHVVDEKMSREVSPIGSRAGGLSEQAAAWTGLPPGTAVAVANVDAHVAAPAATVTQPGTMVLIMGTSICHILLGNEPALVEGMCGVVEDGVVPGLFGFEAGQSAVGDIFAWFAENGVPPEYHEAAAQHGTDVHGVLEAEASRLRPGESGLLALDWWNGNRSILVDAELSGLVVGYSLATKAPDVYRALLEATAFGTRVIVEAFVEAGVSVERMVACGGLPEKNGLLMQIFADVTGREFAVAASRQSSGAGVGDVRSGGRGLGSAVGSTPSPRPPSGWRASATERYVPNAANAAVYDQLYAEYRRLHDLFGRGEDDAMKRLRTIQRAMIENDTTG